MRLGIMQPYFFPYIGYFDLIYRTDRWVVFDTAQYIRHGWVNRNRILHPNEGWLYITVPTKSHHRDTPINRIRIREDGRWRDTIRGQLTHYTNKAPYFDPVFDLVSSCLNDSQGSLARLNVRSLSRVCEYLDIPFRHSLFSEMDLDLGPIEAPGDWALRIAEAMGATEYVNPPGGADLFDRSKFETAGIRLTIQQPVDFVYPCDGYEYEPNLSIVDVLMWNPPEAVRAYLASRSPGKDGQG
jgi:hypothetical protein